MTGWSWVAVLAGTLLIGAALGAGLVLHVKRDQYTRGLLAGQRQAELTSGSWHLAVFGDATNPADVPRPRKRANDHKLVYREIAPTHERAALPHRR